MVRAEFYFCTKSFVTRFSKWRQFVLEATNVKHEWERRFALTLLQPLQRYKKDSFAILRSSLASLVIHCR